MLLLLLLPQGDTGTVVLSGVSATGAVGTLAHIGTRAVTGVSASGSVGTVTASSPSTAGLTGVLATCAVGNMVASGGGVPVTERRAPYVYINAVEKTELVKV